MFFKDCYQKSVRSRVENAFFHIHDYTVTSIFLKMGISYYPKLSYYFQKQYECYGDFFEGVAFKDDNAYYQVLGDLKLGLNLIERDQLYGNLVPVLNNLIDDLLEMQNSTSVLHNICADQPHDSNASDSRTN